MGHPRDRRDGAPEFAEELPRRHPANLEREIPMRHLQLLAEPREQLAHGPRTRRVPEVRPPDLVEQLGRHTIDSGRQHFGEGIFVW